MSKSMSRSFGVFFVLATALILSIGSYSQTPAADNDDLQLWNDINVTVAVNEKLDLFFPLTFRWTKNLDRFNEGRVGAGIIYNPNKSFSVSPFYSHIRYRNSAGEFKTESRYQLRFVYKFPTKGFGLSHRSQFEYRVRPGANTWRYRPSITIEKELPKKFVSGLKIFATEEPFYDSGSGRFSRNRFSVGFNKTITKKVSFDVYYLRQGDNNSTPGTLDVIGTALKIKL